MRLGAASLKDGDMLTSCAVAQDYVHRRGLIAVLHRQTGTQKTGESCMDEISEYMEKWVESSFDFVRDL